MSIGSGGAHKAAMAPDWLDHIGWWPQHDSSYILIKSGFIAAGSVRSSFLIVQLLHFILLHYILTLPLWARRPLPSLPPCEASAAWRCCSRLRSSNICTMSARNARYAAQLAWVAQMGSPFGPSSAKIVSTCFCALYMPCHSFMYWPVSLGQRLQVTA